jgi:hypothetical protein
MSTLIVTSSGARTRMPVGDPHAIERSLQTTYARARIEELVRGILEDALDPVRLDAPPWHDDAAFEAELTAAVLDITTETTGLVAEHLAILLETAPPRLAARLAAASRFADPA